MTTFEIVTIVALAGLPLAVMALTVFNLLTWPRGRPGATLPGRVSVLVPARNEATTIAACVRAILSSDHPVDEVIVCDDGSTDATPEILAQLAAEDDRLRVIAGADLPPGWVGKPHACHRLAEAASGDLLVFVDADVIVADEGLERLASLFGDYDADLVTAVPRQETVGLAERLVVPLLHLTYLAWLPLPLIWRTSDPRFLAANGQVLAVRRETLEAHGGFSAVRAEVVDDMALCRLAKQAGRRVVFADGHRIARCRMYETDEEVWEGFSKNLYEGIGATRWALVGVVGLYSAAFLLPYLALVAGPGVGAWTGAGPGWGAVAAGGAIGVGANTVVRALMAWRFDQPVWGVVWHPVGVLVLLAIALNSYRCYRRGEVRWAGRTYAARHVRKLADTVDSGGRRG